MKDLSINPRSHTSSRAQPPENPQAEPNPGKCTRTRSPCPGPPRVPDGGLQCQGLLASPGLGDTGPSCRPHLLGHLHQAHRCGISPGWPPDPRPPHAGDAGATTKASGCAGWAVPRSARFLLPLRAPGPREFHYYAACEDGSSLRGLGFQTRSLVKETDS